MQALFIKSLEAFKKHSVFLLIVMHVMLHIFILSFDKIIHSQQYFIVTLDHQFSSETNNFFHVF